MLDLWKNKGVGARAMLHAVLLTLGGDPCGQQVGQVDESKREEVAHVAARGGKREAGRGVREKGAFTTYLGWLS